MADIHRLPNIEEVERQASEWIARLNADDVSVDDRAQFETWVGAHPLHARTYEEMLRTWRQFTQAAPEVALAAVAHSPQPARSSDSPRRWRQFAVAASLAIVAVWLGFYLRAQVEEVTFQTALGERSTISLPDGSTLRLNSDSQARVDYSLGSRVVYLERGEAFFDVAHDARRPFWVTTGHSWVRAVGTAFGVYLNRKGVQVTVHEGSVKVGLAERLVAPTEDTLKSASAVLAAGEQADLQGKVTTTRRLTSQQLARAAAWQQGWLYVDGLHLCEVIDQLNRYTPRQLVLEDARLCSLAVGGAFQANPQGADALLTMLEQNFGARIRRGDSHIYIQGAVNPVAGQ